MPVEQIQKCMVANYSSSHLKGHDLRGVSENLTLSFQDIMNP